ncbi:pentapeptide repeat-containing protein [Kaistella anthropi]|nr:pentapeptide repeat-containing protein [Kaistella anthropi]
MCFRELHFYESRLSGISFSNCEFNDCDLSLIIIEKTAFRDVHFNNCKIIGVDFEPANDFGLRFHFKNCNLTHSIFFNKDLRKTVFDHCILHETDFTQANLMESSFKHSDLSGSFFDQTHLEKADFTEALNFRIIPENNFLQKAKFSQHHLSGLLSHLGIEIS